MNSSREFWEFGRCMPLAFGSGRCSRTRDEDESVSVCIPALETLGKKLGTDKKLT